MTGNQQKAWLPGCMRLGDGYHGYAEDKELREYGFDSGAKADDFDIDDGLESMLPKSEDKVLKVMLLPGPFVYITTPQSETSQKVYDDTESLSEIRIHRAANKRQVKDYCLTEEDSFGKIKSVGWDDRYGNLPAWIKNIEIYTDDDTRFVTVFRVESEWYMIELYKNPKDDIVGEIKETGIKIIKNIEFPHTWG